MMKRILILILAIVMVFSLCACGKEQKVGKYCFDCGKGITENASFCEHCGANIKEHLAQNSSGTSTNATSTTTSTTSSGKPSTTSKTTSSSKPTTSTTNSSKPTTNTVTSAQLDIQQKIKNKGEKIKILVPDTTDSSFLQAKAQRYKNLTGGTITWISSAGYSALQQKLVAMHVCDEAPDVYTFTNQDYPSILYKGILAPLDDLIDLNHKVFNNDKTYINSLRWSSKCYLIPEIVTNYDLWVNKKILTDARIPQKEWPDAQYKAGTWTWDSMFDLIKRVSNPESGIFGFGYDNIFLPHAFACSTGADFVKVSGERLYSNVKNNGITCAMNLMRSICVNPNYCIAINKTSAAMLDMFKQDKICMFYGSLNMGSDGVVNEQLKKGNFLLVPFPRDPKVSKTYRMGNITGLSIPIAAHHKNGAAAYILSCYATNDYATQINKSHVNLLNLDSKTLEYYQSNVLNREAVLCFSIGIEEIQTMLRNATSAYNLASVTNWEAVSTELNQKMQAELNMLG